MALIRTPALFDLAAALAEAPFRDVDYLEGSDSSRVFKDKFGGGGCKWGRGDALKKLCLTMSTSLLSLI